MEEKWTKPASWPPSLPLPPASKWGNPLPDASLGNIFAFFKNQKKYQFLKNMMEASVKILQFLNWVLVSAGRGRRISEFKDRLIYRANFRTDSTRETLT